MDPKFQSSFIPKATVAGELRPKQKLGFFGVISAVVLVASLLVLGGVYFYKKTIESSILSLQADVANEKSSIDEVAVGKIIDFDNKIKSIKGLINGHVAVSQYFKLLEENTVTDVQFLNIKYGAPNGSLIDINMKGLASGYATIADQNAVLVKNTSIISPVFDTFTLDPSGGVNFNLKFNLKRDVIDFKNLLQSAPATTQTIKNTNTTSTTTATSTSSAGTENIDLGNVDNLTMPDISNL